MLADLLSKYSVRHLLAPNGVRLAPLVSLRVFENTRGPFGVASVEVAAVIGACVLVLWVWFFFRMPSTHRGQLSSLALGLLLGGGVSNGIERFLLGRTTDILWFGERTAVNIADGAILCGIVLLTLVFFRHGAYRG